jgi:small conductance mechanosensitive channel
MDELNQLLLTSQEVITQFAFNLIAAIAIFVIGRWLVKQVSRFIRRVMSRSQIDPTLISFTYNIVYYVLLAFVIIAALNRLGVQTASVIAILGAAGLAVGLALQGSLSNFAAGVLLVIFRPFKVGDYIEAAGFTGTVEEIQLFTTTLVTPDNTVAIVPNASIGGNNILNYTRKEIRRVDKILRISYFDDIDKARKVILEELQKDSRILADPIPTVCVLELAESSVNLSVRPWVKAQDYWPVYFSMYERLKNRLDAEAISIPLPQRDIHIFQKN